MRALGRLAHCREEELAPLRSGQRSRRRVYSVRSVVLVPRVLMRGADNALLLEQRCCEGRVATTIDRGAPCSAELRLDTLEAVELGAAPIHLSRLPGKALSQRCRAPPQSIHLPRGEHGICV